MPEESGRPGFAHVGERAETREVWEARRRAQEVSERALIPPASEPLPEVRNQGQPSSTAVIWIAGVAGGAIMLGGAAFGAYRLTHTSEAQKRASPVPSATIEQEGADRPAPEARVAAVPAGTLEGSAPTPATEPATEIAEFADRPSSPPKSDPLERDSMAYVLEKFALSTPRVQRLAPQELIQLSSSASLSRAAEDNRVLRELLSNSEDRWAEGNDSGWGPTRARIRWPEARVELVIHRYEKYFCNVLFWPTSAKVPAKGTELQMFVSGLLGQGFIASDTLSYCPYARRASVQGPDGTMIELLKCDSAP